MDLTQLKGAWERIPAILWDLAVSFGIWSRRGLHQPIQVQAVSPDSDLVEIPVNVVMPADMGIVRWSADITDPAAPGTPGNCTLADVSVNGYLIFVNNQGVNRPLYPPLGGATSPLPVNSVYMWNAQGFPEPIMVERGDVVEFRFVNNTGNDRRAYALVDGYRTTGPVE